MWQVIGHEWAVRLLASSLANDRLSHAYLFTGPPGVGKTTLAVNLAQAILCGDAEPPCQTCAVCKQVARLQHPDVRLIEPDGATFKIGQVRELQREAALAPHSGRHRVYILLQAERMSTEAANALLKTLEEPSDPVVLILTASDASLLLPTIVSRCQTLNLRPISTDVVKQALLERGADAVQAELLARISGGRVGWALTALQDPALMNQRRQALDELTEILTADLVTRWEHVAKVSSDRQEIRDMLDLWMTWWHDMLLMQAGLNNRGANLDYRDRLAALAAQCPAGTIRGFLNQMLLSIHQLGQNVQTRLLLEVLTMDMPTFAA